MRFVTICVCMCAVFVFIVYCVIVSGCVSILVV